MNSKIFRYGLMLLLSGILFTSCNEGREIKYEFSHQVYFWLNNPDSQADRQEFEKGIAELLEIPEIKLYHVGLPVEETAGRGVVDGSYTYAYLVFFDDLEGHNIYQDHPIHVKFVEDYSHLWSNVVVYDARIR